MNKRLGMVAAVASVVLAVAGCGSDGGGGGDASDGGNGETVKIGYLASLTGVAAADAAADVAGAEIAIDEINEAGGVDGHELELIVRDDKLDPTTGTREARDLIISDQVNILAGGNVSSVAAGVSDIAGRSKVPYIISTAGSAELTGEASNDYTFRSWTNALSLPGPAAVWASEQGFTRVGVVYANYSNGIEQSNTFKQVMEEQAPDSELVADIPVEVTDTDFSSAINQLRAAKPDVIMLGGLLGAANISFTKQAVPAGLFDSAKVVAFISGGDMEQIAGIVPSGQLTLFNSYFPEIDDEFATEFNAKYEEKTGDVADGSALVGYMTVQWAAEAVRVAGSTDRQALADALPGASMDTFVGEVTIREDGQSTGQAWYGIVETDGEGGWSLTNLGTAPSDEFLPPE